MARDARSLDDGFSHPCRIQLIVRHRQRLRTLRARSVKQCKLCGSKASIGQRKIGFEFCAGFGLNLLNVGRETIFLY